VSTFSFLPLILPLKFPRLFLKVISVMNLRRSIVVLLELLLLAPGLNGQQLSAAPATEILARVHWLGLKQISTDTNAAHFMSVWQLPQTAALVAQTLDKFSRRPGGGATNAASALLRPLLDDLVSSESHLEVCAPTNLQPLGAAHPAPAGEDGSTPLARRSEAKTAQLLLALRLPADRARLWRTNLAAALETLTGVHPVPVGDGWVLRQSHAPDRIEFSRVGDWTLVGLGQDTNDLLSEFAARIARARAPFARSATNFWCVADLDLSRLAVLAPQFLSLVTRHSSLSSLHITALGEGGNVLTRATFNFSRPLDLLLSPWAIPTNLIHQPLTSFTAVRGLAGWLAASPAWQKLELAPPPDQAYFWALTGAAFQTYFAAPLPAASNQLRQLAGRLVQNANPSLATNDEGNFQWQTNPPGLVWNGVFILSPYLKPIIVNQQNYVLGCLARFAEGNTNPPPAEILRAVLDATNLVYYQFEHTGSRIEDDLFVTQLFRVIFHKPQLPAKAASTLWLKNVEPLLGDSTTFVTRTGAEQLAFTRKSTIGFTALELHLLADWLESPRFPHGLHTFLAPPDK
jgi:hypothetical protein